MFARITHYQIKPDHIDEMVNQLDQIKSAVQEIQGLVVSYTSWNDDGAGVTAAYYESEAAAEAAVDQIKAIWGGLAEHLAGPPEVKSYATATVISG